MRRREKRLVPENITEIELEKLLGMDLLKATRRGVRRRRAGDAILLDALAELDGAADEPDTGGGRS